MLSSFRPMSWLKWCFVFTVFGFTLTGCQLESEPKSLLDQIRERGVLRVGTLNNQLSYYIGSDGPTGLDYELAQRFADQLNVKLEMKPAYTLSGLFPALQRNEIDIIAAGLTITPKRLKKFRPGPAYYYVSQQVVYKTGQWRPRNIANLLEQEQNVTVVAGSSHEAHLYELKKQFPELEWTANTKFDDDELLKQVANGDLPYTIADSVDISLTQRIHPDLAVAFELTEDQPIAWFTARTTDDSLYGLIIEFFGKIKQSGKLAKLEEKYFGHVDSFDYVDTRAFIRALDKKLPRWEALFKKYADEFDWRLLAALSYQESHWNPKAVSPTGVRGLMMLTLPTAKSVGVKNRLDPEQSIRGGAEYLRRTLKRVPDSISHHEKIWFALASYNIGFGHMMDARRLTLRQGGDANSWVDVKERLPLLRKRKYYKDTRYGYARGDEAQKYVENIRRYYQSIIGHESAQLAQERNETDLNVDDIQTIGVILPDESTPSSESTTSSTTKKQGSATKH